jgi:hypothetical protein
MHHSCLLVYAVMDAYTAVVSSGGGAIGALINARTHRLTLAIASGESPHACAACAPFCLPVYAVIDAYKAVISSCGSAIVDAYTAIVSSGAIGAHMCNRIMHACTG